MKRLRALTRSMCVDYSTRPPRDPLLRLRPQLELIKSVLHRQQLRAQSGCCVDLCPLPLIRLAVLWPSIGRGRLGRLGRIGPRPRRHGGARSCRWPRYALRDVSVSSRAGPAAVARRGGSRGCTRRFGECHSWRRRRRSRRGGAVSMRRDHRLPLLCLPGDCTTCELPRQQRCGEGRAPLGGDLLWCARRRAVPPPRGALQRPRHGWQRLSELRRQIISDQGTSGRPDELSGGIDRL